MRKCYRIYNGIRAGAIVSLLTGIILLAVLQVVLRYFTSADIKPYPWGDEVMRLSSIWVSFLAASIGVRESSHLSVDYFVRKLVPARALRWMRVFASLLVLTVLVALIWYGISRTRANIPTMMQNLPVSMAWFYAAIPVGSLCLFLDYLLILVYGEHPYGRRWADAREGEVA